MVPRFRGLEEAKFLSLLFEAPGRFRDDEGIRR